MRRADCNWKAIGRNDCAWRATAFHATPGILVVGLLRLRLHHVHHDLRLGLASSSSHASSIATSTTTGGSGSASDAANSPANSAALLRGIVDDRGLLGRGSLRCLREHALVVLPFGLKLVVTVLLCLVIVEFHLCHLQFELTLRLGLIALRLALALRFCFTLSALRVHLRDAIAHAAWSACRNMRLDGMHNIQHAFTRANANTPSSSLTGAPGYPGQVFQLGLAEALLARAGPAGQQPTS